MDGNTMLGSNSPLTNSSSRTENGDFEHHEPSRAPLSVSRFGIQDLDEGFHTPPRKAADQLTREEEQIVADLLEDEIKYIGSPEFTKRNAFKRIYESAPQINRPDVSWYRPLMGDASRKTKKPTSAGKKSSVVLSKDEERALFLKFNYARHLQAEIQIKLAGKKPTKSVKTKLLHWHRVCERYREQITETNLALVLAMAKRLKLSDVDFADLVSEGNMALMRSVDKFDCERGFKFSTYACRAILKAFSRQGMKNARYKQRFPTEFDTTLEKSDHLETLRSRHERECADEVKHIVINNSARLSEVELAVIGLRFGITNDPDPRSRKPKTLEQVGRVVGVTKERVRQIQNKAIKKIRSILEDPRPEIHRNLVMPSNN